MSRARPPVLVASVVLGAALASLALGAALGVKWSELRHLGLLLLVALVATVVATLAARPLLARASVRWRLVAIGGLAVLVSLVNLGVLTMLMSVSHHDATLVAILLVYSVGAGIAAALVLARAWGSAVERLVLGHEPWLTAIWITVWGASEQGPSWTCSPPLSTRQPRGWSGHWHASALERRSART